MLSAFASAAGSSELDFLGNIYLHSPKLNFFEQDIPPNGLSCSLNQTNVMRAVIQRVKEASVDVDGKLKDSIGPGLLVLLGIEDEDGPADIAWLSAKIVNLRIFDDASGVMNVSCKDLGAEIMLVSQFTLHASTKKGNRPSYIRASKPESAIPLYEEMIAALEKDLGKRVATGTFGADMQVRLTNNGPVTILIDTKIKE
jgi:D-tyrosyl-tRNA(Tyr) deacylase